MRLASADRLEWQARARSPARLAGEQFQFSPAHCALAGQTGARSITIDERLAHERGPVAARPEPDGTTRADWPPPPTRKIKRLNWRRRPRLAFKSKSPPPPPLSTRRRTGRAGDRKRRSSGREKSLLKRLGAALANELADHRPSWPADSCQRASWQMLNLVALAQPKHERAPGERWALARRKC